MTKLTKHVRHARLVKLVRKTYQAENPGSRLFPNTSGWAWQGDVNVEPGKVEILHPRPVRFGIPEPAKEGGSGGTDLLGETLEKIQIPMTGVYEEKPILTGIECKTGLSKLKPNQRRFRDWLLSVNGIHKTARECPSCWERWEPVKKSGRIVDWIPPSDCPDCGGKGYRMEE